jgi:hypothetical protein
MFGYGCQSDRHPEALQPPTERERDIEKVTITAGERHSFLKEAAHACRISSFVYGGFPI